MVSLFSLTRVFAAVCISGMFPGDRECDRYEQDEAADLGVAAAADSHPQEQTREGQLHAYYSLAINTVQ